MTRTWSILGTLLVWSIDSCSSSNKERLMKRWKMFDHSNLDHQLIHEGLSQIDFHSSFKVSLRISLKFQSTYLNAHQWNEKYESPNLSIMTNLKFIFFCPNFDRIMHHITNDESSSRFFNLILREMRIWWTITSSSNTALQVRSERNQKNYPQRGNLNWTRHKTTHSQIINFENLQAMNGSIWKAIKFPKSHEEALTKHLEITQAGYLFTVHFKNQMW
jgi:hypothetical protein